MDFLVLTEEHFIGSGSNKKCYVHPKDSTLCIKIIYCDNNGNAKKELKRELHYYRIIARKKLPSQILPKYRGTIQTNLGVGYLYDLIKDSDDNTSKNLNHYLSSPDILQQNQAKILDALKVLKKQMLTENLITMGIFADNILCQMDEENNMTLRIIDNIGTASLIPLEYYFNIFAQARVLRRWDRFMRDLVNLYSNPLIKKITTELNSL